MKKRKKVSLLLKIVIAISAFLLTADILLGSVLVNRSINKMKGIINNKILEIALTAAELVNGDEIEKLTIEDKTNETDAYTTNYDVLAAFKTSSEANNAELAFIYCLVKVDDKIVFSLDPSDEPGDFLVEETVYTDALYAAFDEGKAGFDKQSYVDRWGNLYSAYAPVKSKIDGHVTSVIGVDVWASWYEKEVSHSAVSIGIVSGVTLLLGIGISIIITNNLRRRLEKITNDMNSLESDVQELIKDIRDPRYLPANSSNTSFKENDTIEQLHSRIYATQIEIKQYVAYAHKQAYLDSLTGLGNRAAYGERINAINQMIKEGNIDFSVVVLDINGLKQINDTYGHDSGDKAITIVGENIKKRFGEECTYRIGGDEFVVILVDVDENDNALSELEERIDEFNASEKPVPFKLTISYGKGKFVKGEDDKYRDVFKKADNEMYKFKTSYYRSIGNRRK